MVAYYEMVVYDTTSIGEQTIRVYFDIAITATSDIKQIEDRLGIIIIEN